MGVKALRRRQSEGEQIWTGGLMKLKDPYLGTIRTGVLSEDDYDNREKGSEGLGGWMVGLGGVCVKEESV